MRQSKAEIYLHLVWATLKREAFLMPNIERAVYRCISSEAQRLGCTVLAIGGMPDHVHLCIKLPTRLAVARLMNQVKGVSSHFVHHQLSADLAFQWQEGYAVFSVGSNQTKHVLAYINNQRQHHLEGTVHSRWEETDEEYYPAIAGDTRIMNDPVVNDPVVNDPVVNDPVVNDPGVDDRRE